MEIKPIFVDGTIIDGAIHLDKPLQISDQTRVRVTIVNLDEIERCWDEGLRNLELLKRDHPINSGGLKFTREELYDRDAKPRSD